MGDRKYSLFCFVLFCFCIVFFGFYLIVTSDSKFDYKRHLCKRQSCLFKEKRKDMITGHGIQTGNRPFFNTPTPSSPYDFACDDLSKIRYEKICNDKNI